LPVERIWLIVDKFFKDLHSEQGTDYLSSDCFKADEQEIVHPWQSTTARKRSANHGGHKISPDQKMQNRNKKKMSKEQLQHYNKDHLYYIESATSAQFEVQCKCKNQGEYMMIFAILFMNVQTTFSFAYLFLLNEQHLVVLINTHFALSFVMVHLASVKFSI